jgi:hypothetical protein
MDNEVDIKMGPAHGVRGSTQLGKKKEKGKKE